MNMFLLFMGQQYYPQPGFEDLIGAYATKQQALDFAKSSVEFLNWAQIVELPSFKVETYRRESIAEMELDTNIDEPAKKALSEARAMLEALLIAPAVSTPISTSKGGRL